MTTFLGLCSGFPFIIDASIRAILRQKQAVMLGLKKKSSPMQCSLEDMGLDLGMYVCMDWLTGTTGFLQRIEWHQSIYECMSTATEV